MSPVAATAAVVACPLIYVKASALDCIPTPPGLLVVSCRKYSWNWWSDYIVLWWLISLRHSLLSIYVSMLILLDDEESFRLVVCCDFRLDLLTAELVLFSDISRFETVPIVPPLLLLKLLLFSTPAIAYLLYFVVIGRRTPSSSTSEELRLTEIGRVGLTQMKLLSLFSKKSSLCCYCGCNNCCCCGWWWGGC